MTPQDDDLWIEAALSSAVVPAPEDAMCIVNPEFDAGILQAWKLNTLSADAVDTVMVHLADCTFCRALTSDLVPLSDESVRALANTVPRAKAGRAPLIAGLVIAAAAAAFLFVQPSTSIPVYHADPLGGAVALVKSGTASESTVFVPTSRLHWVLRPTTHLDAPPTARAFQVDSHGVLQPLLAQALQQKDGGTWVLSGLAQDLLGEPTGKPVTVVVVLANDQSSKLQGRRWSTVRSAQGVRGYETQVNYQASPQGEK